MRCVVVGAGVLGASTAFHLAVAGHEVVVLDAGGRGAATAAGAGIVCPWASTLPDGPFYDLYAAGAAAYDEVLAALADVTSSPTGHARVGALVLPSDEHPLADVADRVDARTRDVPVSGGCEVVDVARARALFPPLGDVPGAVLVPGAARVDGRALTAALLDGAVAAGAVVRATRATVARDESGEVRVLDGDGDDVPADQVVVTAGAWADGLLAPVGVGLDVAPQKGQIVHLDLPGTDTSRWPSVLPPGAHYLLAFDGGRVVVGATREDGSGFDARVTAGGVAAVLRAALDVAPGLGDAVLAEVRVGLRPVATSGAPVLGRPGGDGRLVVGNGLGAAGLTTGPLAGRLLAQVATGTATDVDLAPFAPSGPAPGQRA